MLVISGYLIFEVCVIVDVVLVKLVVFGMVNFVDDIFCLVGILL